LGAAAGVHTNRHFGFYLLHDHFGPRLRCLVDALDGELAIARSMADAPEIDGLVQIQNGFMAGLKPGEFVDVEIMGS
ncbi:hypothetical protein AB4142_38835, partial [Variovorax sp. 2RAF20]